MVLAKFIAELLEIVEAGLTLGGKNGEGHYEDFRLPCLASLNSC